MNIDYAVQRMKMVDGQLRTTDITNPRLLAAMSDVPREAFVPAAKRSLAYIDEDLEVSSAGDAGQARYLMNPSPFGKLVQLADVQPGDVVLDVGCGTGYSTAVLSKLATSVIALESDEALCATATETLSELDFDNVAVVHGSLLEGYKSEAPYDVIFVGGAVDRVPDSLLAQLREGGRLVVVEGQGNAGVACIYIKENNVISHREEFNAAVRPLIEFKREPAFEF